MIFSSVLRASVRRVTPRVSSLASEIVLILYLPFPNRASASTANIAIVKFTRQGA